MPVFVNSWYRMIIEHWKASTLDLIGIQVQTNQQTNLSKCQNPSWKVLITKSGTNGLTNSGIGPGESILVCRLELWISKNVTRLKSFSMPTNCKREDLRPRRWLPDISWWLVTNCRLKLVLYGVTDTVLESQLRKSHVPTESCRIWLGGYGMPKYRVLAIQKTVSVISILVDILSDTYLWTL